MAYGRIKYGIFFKKVFGQKPHITRAFLNTVLRDDLKSPIKTVEFQPNDFILQARNSLINEAKHDVIDIFCTDQEGNRMLIEIQKGGNKFAIPRFLDYQCRSYSSQFRPGDLYKNVVGCYSICWMFDIQPPHTSLLEKIRLCSNEKETDWAFDWQMTALYPRNLGGLDKLEEEIRKASNIRLEEWLVLDVVTDMEKAAAIKKVLQHDEVKEAFEDLDLSGYTEQQLREAEYIEFLGEYSDLVQKHVAEEVQKAVAKEAEKKLYQQKIAIAKSILEFADLAAAQKATGLSMDVLKSLK